MSNTECSYHIIKGNANKGKGESHSNGTEKQPMPYFLKVMRSLIFGALPPETSSSSTTKKITE